MEVVTLTRTWWDDKSTMGVISHPKLRRPLVCFELPWKQNQLRVSCIPPGEYTMRPWRSPTFNRLVYRLDDGETAPRSDILIHPANYPSQLLGCIAPGKAYNFWQGEGKGWGVVNSGDSLDLLFEALDGKEAKLVITEVSND